MDELFVLIIRWLIIAQQWGYFFLALNAHASSMLVTLSIPRNVILKFMFIAILYSQNHAMDQSKYFKFKVSGDHI